MESNNYIVFVKVMDNVGNSKIYGSNGIVLENFHDITVTYKEDPAETTTQQGTVNSRTYYSGDAKLNLTAKENASESKFYSGLEKMQYTIFRHWGDGKKDTEEEARRKRNRVHIGLSVLLIFFICLVDALNNQSVIDAIYIIASYTYGPLLGMFAFGLFTQRKTNDRWVPFIAIASPLICYAADRFARQETGYQFGYELLMLNGILTFAGNMDRIKETTKK